MTPSKKAKITDENRRESERLKLLWDATTTKRSQTIFAEVYDLGTQGNVGHYLNGRSPLNPKAAIAFANELNCQVSDFSPRVAREIAALTSASIRGTEAGDNWPASAWPFDQGIVSQERYMALPDAVKTIVQVRLLEVIREEESRLPKQDATQKAASRAA